MKTISALLFFFIISFSATAQSKADTLFFRQEYSEALKIYLKEKKKTPPSPLSLYRIGFCYFSLKDYPHAVEYMAMANIRAAVPQYNLACAYAHNGNADSALACLGRVAKNGYTYWQQTENDTDLVSIKSDPRFTQIISTMKNNAEPCLGDPRYREFDFWIGEWDVTSTTNGTIAGSSSIQLILGSCVILENWTGASGNVGKSFNTFNSSDGKWMQTWVDNQGSVVEFIDGVFSDNAMRFASSRQQPQASGTITRHRLTFYKIDENTVRQFGEVSNDDGKTWQTEYDLTYRRKK